MLPHRPHIVHIFPQEPHDLFISLYYVLTHFPLCYVASLFVTCCMQLISFRFLFLLFAVFLRCYRYYVPFLIFSFFRLFFSISIFFFTYFSCLFSFHFHVSFHSLFRPFNFSLFFFFPFFLRLLYIFFPIFFLSCLYLFIYSFFISPSSFSFL